MKGNYTLTLSDGKEIHMRFTTWAIANFADKFKMSFSDVIDLFASGKISINHIMQLMLSGAEYVARKEAKQFTYNDLDAGEWVDDMGGAFSPKVQELLREIAKTLSGGEQEGGKEAPKGDGKK